MGEQQRHRDAPRLTNRGIAAGKALLDSHFISGDGRTNENIGLTAIHEVFHAEHNLVLADLKDRMLDNGNGTWTETATGRVWSGDDLFQAAKLVTEMEYQHLVFGEFARKRPHELSGGMRQRVALARAFAQDADLLCMDEPFGALDAMTRDLLHDELERLWADRSLTVVFVTHNVREAVRLGDRVVVLTSRPGRVAEEFRVDIERPRRIESAEVSALARTITERLREEVRRHGRVDA